MARVRRNDGEWRWIQSFGAPRFAADGRFLGAVGSSPDITELIDASDTLREADRRKDEFLATLAHELRNPLAPIRQAARLSRSPNATEAQRRWSQDVIERQVQHMALLLDDLLDVSRITRGKLELRMQRVATRERRRSRAGDDPAAARRTQAATDDQPASRAGMAQRRSAARCSDPRQPADQCGEVFGARRPHRPVGRAYMTTGCRSASRTRASASNPNCCRACSRCSRRSRARSIAPKAGSASAWRSSRGWSSCTAERVEAKSDGLGKGAEFVVAPAASRAWAAARRNRRRPRA